MYKKRALLCNFEEYGTDMVFPTREQWIGNIPPVLRHVRECG